MKVCLISPGWIAPPKEIETMFLRCGIPFPLGLGYLASFAESHGFKDIQILDLLVSGWTHHTPVDSQQVYIGLPPDKFHEALHKIQPDAVGISCTFTSQAEALHMVAESVKAFNPKIPVIAGGAHPSSSPVSCMEDKNIDLVIEGEGEIPFLKLLECKFQGAFSHIEGLYFKEGNKITFNGKSDFIKNLDDIPYPAYHKLDVSKYLEAGEKGLGQRGGQSRTFSIITSRGCPYQCNFCSIHNISGSRWRGRSPSNVLGEINMLVERYGAKHFLFEDDNLTMDIGRAEEIFREIAGRHPGVTWSAPNGIRADRMSDALAKSMKRSGCTTVSLGIESGDQEFLQNTIKKKLDLKAVETTVNILNNSGILVIGFFVLGIPGESERTIKNSMNFAAKLAKMGLVAHFFLATPLPNTRLLEEAKAMGILTKKNFTSRDYFLSAFDKPLLKNYQIGGKTLLEWRKICVFKIFLTLLIFRPLLLLKYLAGSGDLKSGTFYKGLLNKWKLFYKFVWSKK